jgi:hypothetical protein
MLIVPALRGFHSGEGIEYKKVFLRQGAKGPLVVPDTQEFFSPHQPQPDCLTQLGGFMLYMLQLT